MGISGPSGMVAKFWSGGAKGKISPRASPAARGGGLGAGPPAGSDRRGAKHSKAPGAGTEGPASEAMPGPKGQGRGRAGGRRSRRPDSAVPPRASVARRFFGRRPHKAARGRPEGGHGEAWGGAPARPGGGGSGGAERTKRRRRRLPLARPVHRSDRCACDRNAGVTEGGTREAGGTRRN